MGKENGICGEASAFAVINYFELRILPKLLYLSRWNSRVMYAKIDKPETKWLFFQKSNFSKKRYFSQKGYFLAWKWKKIFNCSLKQKYLFSLSCQKMAFQKVISVKLLGALILKIKHVGIIWLFLLVSLYLTTWWTIGGNLPAVTHLVVKLNT